MKKILTTFIILLTLICLQAKPAMAGMDPFVGEIEMVGFNYAPQGWALCDGSILSIQSYSALYALIGTTYGGNGVTTFALPDLRGRVAIGQGQGAGLTNRVIGSVAGTEKTYLTVSNLPVYTSTATVTGSASGKIMASTDAGTTSIATGAVLASSTSKGTPVKAFKPVSGPIDVTNATQLASNNMVAMTDSTVLVDVSKIIVKTTSPGSGTAFDNMQPSLTVNYIIAIEGTWPSRP